MRGLLATLQFDAERMQVAADAPHSAATDLAEQLVRTGTPFRDAHAIVGALVRESLEGGAPLADLVATHPAFTAGDGDLLLPGTPVRNRTTPGGAGPDAVAVQLARFRSQLDADRQRIDP